MTLSEILSISGYPGLFKFVAQSKNGIIVESLLDKKRMLVQGSSKVSTLGDIAIFTVEEDIALGQVFDNIFKGCEGKESISHKSDEATLRSEFAKFLPEYDEDRVRVSDIKKVFSWYNILIGAGFTEFVEEEEAETEEVEATEE
ncbi:MAG: DUF5606 domain-containing protein [Rikenellaceae bacterium]